jgi:chemotaxis protein CheC
MTTELSELQHDALVEIFNIGVGQAANSLSQIVGDEIALSVPEINILRGERIEGLKRIIRSPRVCAVSQNFTGDIETEAFLIFPEGKTLEIVRRMLGDAVGIGELGEIEQEAMSEIGNIILNACISAISELLHAGFNSSLPVYRLGSVSDILSHGGNHADGLLMLLYIDFSIPTNQVDGYLVFFLPQLSFDALIRKIDQFLSGIVQPTHGK